MMFQMWVKHFLPEAPGNPLPGHLTDFNCNKSKTKILFHSVSSFFIQLGTASIIVTNGCDKSDNFPAKFPRDMMSFLRYFKKTSSRSVYKIVVTVATSGLSNDNPSIPWYNYYLELLNKNKQYINK